MGKSPSSDLGFKYIQALSRAIETYTGSAEAINSSAFKYRGVNLKYAVERYLYFAFVNDERLYQLFTQCIGSELLDKVELVTELERDLAIYLCEPRLTSSFIRVRPRDRTGPGGLLHRLRCWAGRSVYSLLRRPGTPSVRESDSLPAPRANKPVVLLHVIHEKFVRYLRPVTDCLPVPFAYLLTAELDLESYFRSQGLPFIKCSDSYKPSVSHKLSNVLYNFQHLTRWYDQVYACLMTIRPQYLVLAEGNSPQNEIVNRACMQLSIPVICIQQGWSPIIHNGFRNMSYTKMLVWGEGFKELLQPYNPHQKFVVTGSHIIDSLAPITRGSQYSRKAVCFFLQGSSRLISNEHFDEFLQLVRWVANEFTELPILVREHPSCPLPIEEQAELVRFPNIRLMPPYDYSVADVLNASRLSVSIYSSTILESIAGGVLPLIFNMTSLPSYFPDVQAVGAGIEVKSMESAKQVICHVVRDESFVRHFEPAMEQFQKAYFFRDNRKTVNRIIEEITSLSYTPSVQ